jgi:RND family efflux transporter MFP subunit
MAVPRPQSSGLAARPAVLAFLVCAAALLGLAGCGSKAEGGAKGDGAAAPKAQPAREVEAAKPRLGAFARAVTLSGALEAKDTVEIVARVEGPVVSVNSDLGARVARGALLAKIDAEDATARSGQAEAERAQAEADLARLERLAATHMATPQTVEQARTRAAVARAQAQLIARQLRDTGVRAPFAGGVTRRDVSVGAYVRVGTPLFSLVSSENLRLVLEVPENYLGLVTEGQTARVTVGGNALDATLSRVSPALDPARRTFRVEADIPGAPGLAAGMFVTATLEVGTADRAARIPRPAVFSVLGRSRVMVATGGKAAVREVELLGEEGTDAIVLGLNENDLVITRGPQGVAPGTAVVAKNAQ